jgi:MFS family permease
VFATINVLAIAARIGSGRISDRLGSRLRPLRTIGIMLTISTAAVAAATDAPLALVVTLFVIAGVFSMAWNGLSYAAAAEMAGSARTGAALGFQQTLLGVVGAAFPPAFAWVVDTTSWQTAFALSTLGPALGLVLLRKVPEPTGAARRPEMSAIPPAAR